MAKIHGQDVLPDIRLPRKPRSDKEKRRAAYNAPERALRLDVMKFFRGRHIKFWRIENSLPGYRGLPDFLFFKKNKFYFMELKSETGTLRPEQKTFRELCRAAGITYLEIRTLEGLETVCLI